jgi:hypothetical protein
VQVGEAWKAGTPTVPLMGGLAIIEFNITAKIPQGDNATSVLDMNSHYPGDTFVLDYDSGDNIGNENVYNANAILPIVPEFATVTSLLMALIAVSALPLLAKKSLKKPNSHR